MPDSSVAVSVKDLRKRYGGFFKSTVDALQGVTFDVPKGQIFGLLGPNGAGKTTIIKILLGIIRSSGGSASLLGHPAGDRLGRKRVGYLPENLQLAPHQNARTALEYFGRLSGMDYATIKSRGDELLEQVGLHGRKKESVKQFSKGMRQRLGLAQALLHDPELLILDEPTEGLDPVGRSQVRDIMRELSRQGRTVFLNSHLLQEVELVCDHVAILTKGELKYVGSVEELASVTNQSELTIEVTGSGEVLKNALQEWTFSLNLIPGSTERYTIRLKVNDQPDVDRVVDSLRQQNVSINSLSRGKVSLEDFFLNVVNQTPYQA